MQITFILTLTLTLTRTDLKGQNCDFRSVLQSSDVLLRLFVCSRLEMSNQNEVNCASLSFCFYIVLLVAPTVALYVMLGFYISGYFFRFSLSPLMLQVSLQVA